MPYLMLIFTVLALVFIAFLAVFFVTGRAIGFKWDKLEIVKVFVRQQRKWFR